MKQFVYNLSYMLGVELYHLLDLFSLFNNYAKIIKDR